MNKLEALELILEALKDHQVVVCNGMIGREVFTVADRPNHFYMIGSMGIATSIALGLAHCAPKRKVAVIEGDGNTLMGLPVLAQVCADAPSHFVHICLDNGVHASTGGQKTISSAVHLEKIAAAAGYTIAVRAETRNALEVGLKEVLAASGPAFLLATVEPGTIAGIARVSHTPPEITARFQKSVTAG